MQNIEKPTTSVVAQNMPFRQNGINTNFCSINCWLTIVEWGGPVEFTEQGPPTRGPNNVWKGAPIRMSAMFLEKTPVGLSHGFCSVAEVRASEYMEGHRPTNQFTLTLNVEALTYEKLKQGAVQN